MPNMELAGSIHKTPGKTGAWLVTDNSEWVGAEGGNHSAHTSCKAAKAEVLRSWPSAKFEKSGVENNYVIYVDTDEVEELVNQEPWREN